jgi:hypothetical protein
MRTALSVSAYSPIVPIRAAARSASLSPDLVSTSQTGQRRSNFQRRCAAKRVSSSTGSCLPPDKTPVGRRARRSEPIGPILAALRMAALCATPGAACPAKHASPSIVEKRPWRWIPHLSSFMVIRPWSGQGSVIAGGVSLMGSAVEKPVPRVRRGAL